MQNSHSLHSCSAEVQSERSTVNLLWTGGWDSTFRLLELVLIYHLPVQPYYVVDTNRQSSLQELTAMHRIRESVAQRSKAAAVLIKPSILVSIHDIESDPEIKRKLEGLREQGHLGGQYEWLARLVQQYKIVGLELCIHLDDKAYGFIKEDVQLVESQKGQSYWTLVPAAENSNLSIFQHYRFPVLKLTKLQMQAQAQQSGFLPIMEHTWFCFTPVKGKPCGVCNPCRYTIEEGMGHRLPRQAINRYHVKKLTRPLSVIKSSLGKTIRSLAGKSRP